MKAASPEAYFAVRLVVPALAFLLLAEPADAFRFPVFSFSIWPANPADSVFRARFCTEGADAR